MALFAPIYVRTSVLAAACPETARANRRSVTKKRVRSRAPITTKEKSLTVINGKVTVANGSRY